MPSAMVDATVAAAPLDHNARRHRHRTVALSNANSNAPVAAAPKPIKGSKTVASRYLAPFSKTSTISSPAVPRPPASADRSRPAQPTAVATDVAVASSGGSTTTTRTLAVAFQSPAYSLDTSKTRSASPVTVPPPVAMPEKKRSGAAAARAKVFDASQNTYRWPPTAPPRRASVDGANEYLLALSSSSSSSEQTDTSSSSGGSGDGVIVPPRRSVGSGPPRPSPIRSVNTTSSARFAMGTRSDRFAYPATPSRTSDTSSPSPAPVKKKKKSLFNGLLSSPFGRSSLKQQVASSFRRTDSPIPARRSTGNMQGKASPTGYGLDGDTKLKPTAATKADEEHRLRLLYTQHLQWRLVNAQAGAALYLQTTAAERSLTGAWISILRMRKLVAIRKMQLQLLRNNCKLMAVLKGQMKYLEEWSFLERDYAHSLSGTTQALNATVLRLPVSNGAMVDIQGIKNVLSSAVDALHSLGNSCTAKLPKLARTNVLVSQLSRVFIQEHILMVQCRDLLSILASMHVKYGSLQGQRIQLNQKRLQHFQ